MQKKYLYLSLSLCFIAIVSKAQYANTALSNLTSPTKINVNLLPSKDSSFSLGNNTKSWKNLFIKGKIYISDTPMIYSISNSDFFAGPNAGIKLKFLNGQENTGIGTNALYYGAYDNTAVGWNSMRSDSIGHDNSALGGLSLANNIDGNYNVAAGWASSYWNTNGSYNTSIGNNAGETNISGSYNTCVGASALEKNLSSNNTAIGDEAGINNSRGSNNSYVGFHAGNTVTTGNSNTIIGYGADVNDGTLSNATAIGNLAITGASNRVRIGNGSVTSIGGAVGWTNFSDERIKNNIKENVPGLAFINLLKPVTYHFDLSKEENILGKKNTDNYKEKYDIQKIQFSGFLAQQVEAAAKKINYDFSGVDVPAGDKDIYGLRYADFVVPLVKAVQELSSQNNSLKSEIQNLKSEIENIKAMIVSNQSIANVQQSTALPSATLFQNVPNPFSNSTSINYSLPVKYSSAKIIITDKIGNASKTISLSNNKGSVNIDASMLSSGVYQYSLYVDGQLIDTKQMVLSK
ncbi:MAG TPA: tail fiber domain-containing protein [Parafilimonas sp.]|nr:tail fiber domain-containing protein [Parafilimonas sp.]